MNLFESFSEVPSLFLVFDCVFVSGGENRLLHADDVDRLEVLSHYCFDFFDHLPHCDQTLFVLLLAYLSLFGFLGVLRVTFFFMKPVISRVPCFSLLTSISMRMVVANSKVASSPLKLMSTTLKESQFPLKSSPSFGSRPALLYSYTSWRSIRN